MNVQDIRKDFPILLQRVHDKPLVYFDNAASTQKPMCVIDAITNYYTTINSNVHRGVHHLSQLATDAFEHARRNVQHFINAEHDYEIIFTKGATESINLLAQCFSDKYLNVGDEVIITIMEHHSNIVPWQVACEKHGAKLKCLIVNEAGELRMDLFDELITDKTKIIAVAHISNVLGTINPVKEIITKAHSLNIPVMLDGAQAVLHTEVDVQELDCDFYCFSGHKMCAPMGVGVLYGKEKYLNEMPPYQYGGEMISEVKIEKSTYNSLPFKFEAGTPNVGDVLGLSIAIDYIKSIGMKEIIAYEDTLIAHATAEIIKFEDVKLYGISKNKASVLSFNFKNIHPSDVGSIIDQMGVAVRTGHHCAQPLMDFYKIPGTIRASFTFYNTKEEIDIFIDSLRKAITMLA